MQSMESTASLMKPGDSIPRKRKVYKYKQFLMVMFLAFFGLCGVVSFTPLQSIQFLIQASPLRIFYAEVGGEPRNNSIGTTGHYIFEMRGRLSHLDIMSQIKSFGYTCGDISKNTNLTNSIMYITNVGTGQVDIVIETYNHLGERKTTGGDILVIWAEETKNTRHDININRIAGSLIDNMNGSYTGKVIFHVNGTFTVYAKVLSLYRTQCLRLKAMEQYGNSVFSLPGSYGIFFTFRRGSVYDVTRCSPVDFIYGYTDLCNFTSLNLNYSYYCGKPSHGLHCSEYEVFNMRKYELKDIGIQRSRGDIIFNPGWGKLATTVSISVNTLQRLNNTTPLPFCFNKPKLDSWTTLPSHVYCDKGEWSHITCKTKQYNSTGIRKCLANKKVFFIGDSTIRQYVEEIGLQIKKKVNYHPFSVTLNDIKDNINITWRKHELPFHNIAVRNPNQVNSTSYQIRNIGNDETILGEDLILGLNYNTHLQAFPPDIFRDRIKRLVKALVYLFAKKPGVNVLFKGPPVTSEPNKWFDARISLLYADILMEEFAALKHKVRFLDVLTISVYNNNHELHPSGVTLKNQLQQFIAYVCP